MDAVRVRRRRRARSAARSPVATSTRSTSSSISRRRFAGAPAALAASPGAPPAPQPQTVPRRRLDGRLRRPRSCSSRAAATASGRARSRGRAPPAAAAPRDLVKDAAEHVMIVDLERNDLSRVCVAGSVRWPELMTVRSLAGVEHMVSTVEGTLRDGVGLAELLTATFPGGSITGAPKIAAVDLIAALEPVGRGASMGALGQVYGNGDLDLALTIRTFAVADGRIHLWVGGGVVWDSDPAGEVEESWVRPVPCSRRSALPLSENGRPAFGRTRVSCTVSALDPARRRDDGQRARRPGRSGPGRRRRRVHARPGGVRDPPRLRRPRIRARRPSHAARASAERIGLPAPTSCSWRSLPGSRLARPASPEAVLRLYWTPGAPGADPVGLALVGPIPDWIEPARVRGQRLVSLLARDGHYPGSCPGRNRSATPPTWRPRPRRRRAAPTTPSSSMRTASCSKAPSRTSGGGKATGC